MKRHICLQLTKIQVFKLYHLFLLLSLAVLLLLSRSPRNTKTRLIRLKHLKIKKKNKMIGNERKQVRCPSCGGTDHSRSSNKLCPMNKSKTKLPKPKNTVEKAFVIKTSLANTYKYPKLVTLIQEVVDHITQLVYDGSIFANYYFLELLKNGEELPAVIQNLFYNIFSIFASQEKYASDSIKKSFMTFCESTFLTQSDLDKYARKGYMTIVSSMAKQYETLVRNYICSTYEDRTIRQDFSLRLW